MPGTARQVIIDSDGAVGEKTKRNHPHPIKRNHPLAHCADGISYVRNYSKRRPDELKTAFTKSDDLFRTFDEGMQGSAALEVCDHSMNDPLLPDVEQYRGVVFFQIFKPGWNADMDEWKANPPIKYLRRQHWLFCSTRKGDRGTIRTHFLVFSARLLPADAQWEQKCRQFWMQFDMQHLRIFFFVCYSILHAKHLYPTPMPSLIFNTFNVFFQTVFTFQFRATHAPARWIGTKWDKDFHRAMPRTIKNLVCENFE